MASRADRFAQLTGAFDDPIAPSPAFAAHLRAHLVAELSTPPHPVPATPNGRKELVMLATVATKTPPPAHRLRPGTRKDSLLRPRWTRTMALVNVAAILLLLVGIARFFAPDKPAPDATYRLPAISSQPSGSPSTPQTPSNDPASMWGANPAQTWNMAAIAPDVSSWQPTVAVQGIGSPISAAIIHNGVLYMSSVGQTSGATPLIKAVDIASGKTLWTTPLDIYGRIAATDDSLYVLHAISNPGNKGYSARLTSLDTKTGQIRWELKGQTITPLRDTPDIGPVIDGDRIYLATPQGLLLIVDPQTGAPQAVLGPLGPIAYAAHDASTGDTMPILPGGSVGVDQNSIFSILYDGTLVAYDINRKNLDGFNQRWITGMIGEKSEAKVIGARLMVSQGTVVALVDSGIPTGNISSPYRSITKTLVAFDAANGHMLWTRDLSGGGNRMTIAAGNVVVSLGGTDNTPVRVAAYDLKDGSDRWNMDSGFGKRPVWLSAAGDAVYVLSPQGTVTEVRYVALSGGNAVKVQNLPTLPVTKKSLDAFYGPLVLDGGSLYAIGGDGTVIRYGGSSAAATPSASPVATPRASNVAMQIGANPEQTYQYGVSVGAPKQTTTLGAPLTPNDLILGGALINDGMLYRIRSSNGSVALGTRTSVEEVSLADGSSITSFFDPNHAPASLLLHGDELLVVSDPVIGKSTDATLTLVGVSSRRTLWSVDLFANPLPASRPLLAGDMVFVADANGEVHGVDLTTQRVAWTTPLPLPGEAVPVLAADDTMLYVANGYDLSAIDQASGATRWQADLSQKLLGISSIGVSNGKIVVGGLLVTGRASTPASAENLNQSRVVAVSTQDHTVQWQWDTPDQLTQLFVVADGKVMIGHGSGGPYGDSTVLDLTTGKVAWQLKGAMPIFADRDQIVAVTLEIHAAPGTRPATPIAGSNRPVFQQPSTQTSITLLGIDPATGTAQWVLGESVGAGNPITLLPFDRGLAIPLSNGQVVVLRDS